MGGGVADKTRQLFRVKLMAAMLAAVVDPAHAQLAEPATRRMPHVGKSFLFDYGEMVIRVRYLSESRLEWEQIKGPERGLKAEEQYGHARVREDVVFFWWQEKDTSVVTQVVDFSGAVVHTTWTSPDHKLASFQGKLRPLK